MEQCTPSYEEHRWEPRRFYPVKQSIIIKGKRKNGGNSLQQLMTTKLVLQKVLEGIIWTEKDAHTPRGIKERMNNARIMICKIGP